MQKRMVKPDIMAELIAPHQMKHNAAIILPRILSLIENQSVAETREISSDPVRNQHEMPHHGLCRIITKFRERSHPLLREDENV
ncbi:hypothetical protein M8J76_009293 [Diaphorina citri]|nr:hypothetical protein M8J76_009293 [Diaphorina citri]